MSTLDFSNIPQHIQNSESVLILLNDEASFDEQLAASSLLLALQEHGKSAFMAGPKQIKNPTIVGLDQLKTELGHKNLVISLDYEPEAVNNVSYHIDEETQKFYLTIKPDKGCKPLNKNSVELDYAGAEADLIILFGVPRLDDLGRLYYGYEDFYKNTPLISFDGVSGSYAEYFVDTSAVSSVCEAVFQMLEELEMEVGSESATNLLAGVQYETRNFVDPAADANTFEAVAQLLRAGARRRAGVFSRVTSPKEKKSQQQKGVVKEEIEVGRSAKRRGEEKKGPKEKVVKKESKPKKKKDGIDEEDKSSTPVRPSGLRK